MADDTSAIRPYVQELMLTLHGDLPRLLRIDRYIHGQHDDPYIPDSAGAEYVSLVRRAITNWFPLIIGSSAQSLYVDSVRPGRALTEEQERERLPEWDHWEVSRLKARQVSLYEEAIGYGHAFTHTGERGGKIQTKCLSPLKTAALYSDPANDETPTHAMTINEWPSERRNGGVGDFTVWDSTDEYLVYFETLSDIENIVITKIGPHGSSSCPITRFAAKIDLVGRTTGVVEPLIALQDRINQTVLDLLVVQSGGAFKVRTVTGMAPPIKMMYEEDEDGQLVERPVLDSNGQPIPVDVQINAKRFMWAEDKEVQFGTLDETPLDGFLKAIEDAVKQIAAISQTPPHYLLGSIVNLSAEALQAAETSLERKVMAFRAMFGESWERVFRLAAELNNIAGAIDDYDVEVIWRDMEARSLNKTADGLLKLKQLGAPTKGLIEMVPGMTKPTLFKWEDWMDEERQSATGQLASELSKVNSTRAATRQQAVPADQVP